MTPDADPTQKSNSIQAAIERWTRELDEARRTPTLPEEPAWMAGFRRSLHECDPPPPEDLRRLSVEETRAMIRGEISEYLANPQPPHILLIRAAPGVGKTTAGVAAAETFATDRHGPSVLYAGPRHDFWQDVMEIAEQPEWWHEWLPRQLGTEEKLETCPYEPHISCWMQRGWKGIDFCSRVCGWKHLQANCTYHAQRSTEARIIFGMHQHVTLGHPLNFDLLVGDESPIGTFAHPWRIPHRWVRPLGMDPESDFTHMMEELRELTESGASIWGANLLKVLDGPERVLLACKEFNMAVGDAFLRPDIKRPSQAEEVDYCHLPPLVELLQREATLASRGQEYPTRIEVSNQRLTLYLRHRVNERMPGHVVWLDATGEPRLYQACLGRPVKVVDASPQLAGSIFQVHDRLYGKSALAGRANEPPNAKRVSEAEATVLKIIVDRGYTNPAIISFKALTEREGLVRELEHGHFYAARGTNQFEGCDAIFVLGTPQPPINQLARTAKMIWFERDRPFRPDWITRERAFRYVAPDGRGRSYDVSGFWNDDALDALLWSSREAEILQAAHRVRPVHRDVDVWLLTNLPIPELPLDRLYTVQELLDAPEGVNVFTWAIVVEFALRCVEGHYCVTSVDIREKFDLDKRTARRYVDKIIEHLSWERVTAARPKGRRGRSPRAAAPRAE